MKEREKDDKTGSRRRDGQRERESKERETGKRERGEREGRREREGGRERLPLPLSPTRVLITQYNTQKNYRRTGTHTQKNV